MKPSEIARVHGESLEDVKRVVRYAESVRHDYYSHVTDDYSVTALAEECEDMSGVVVDSDVYYEVAYYVCYEA